MKLEILKSDLRWSHLVSDDTGKPIHRHASTLPCHYVWFTPVGSKVSLKINGGKPTEFVLLKDSFIFRRLEAGDPPYLGEKSILIHATQE
jgi:hypothetical protein